MTTRKVHELAQSELNGLVRQGLEAWFKDRQPSAVDKLVTALEPYRDQIKDALRAKASLASLSAHFQTCGLKCSPESLREALAHGGFRRKRGKGPDENPAKPAAAGGV